jgi:hypothetical protein
MFLRPWRALSGLGGVCTRALSGHGGVSARALLPISLGAGAALAYNYYGEHGQLAYAMPHALPHARKATPQGRLQKRSRVVSDSDEESDGPITFNAPSQRDECRSSDESDLSALAGSRWRRRDAQRDSGADDSDDADDVLKRFTGRAPGSKAKAPRSEIEWEVFAQTPSGSAEWLDQQFGMLMRAEGLPEGGLKGKAWTATQQGTTWRRLFYCPYSRRAQVNCGWRVRLTVEGEQRDKDAALELRSQLNGGPECMHTYMFSFTQPIRGALAFGPPRRMLLVTS